MFIKYRQSPHFHVDYKHPNRHKGQRAVTDVDGFPMPVVIKRVHMDYDKDGATAYFEAETDTAHFRKEYKYLVGFELRTYPRISPDELWPNMAAYLREHENEIMNPKRKPMDAVSEQNKQLPTKLAEEAARVAARLCTSLSGIAEALGKGDWTTAQRLVNADWDGYTNTLIERMASIIKNVGNMRTVFNIRHNAMKVELRALMDRLVRKRKRREESSAEWNRKKLESWREWLFSHGFAVQRTRIHGTEMDSFVLPLKYGVVSVSLPVKGVWHAAYAVCPGRNGAVSAGAPEDAGKDNPVVRLTLGTHVVTHVKGRNLWRTIRDLCFKSIGDRDKFNVKWQNLFSTSGRASECYGADIQRLFELVREIPPGTN